ncbi:phosphodiesterase [Lewinellaceae bacterium SD302]|nr:phosphodiesterase [Lewinellaceae bacterium SD302]
MKNHLIVFVVVVTAILAQNDLHTQQSAILYGHDRSSDNEDPTNTIPGLAPFYHGVASGDPLADRVVIWTRVTPDTLNAAPIDVNWRVATDPDLENVVNNGTVMTNAERDYTVKVDVTGLNSGTTYYYGFSALQTHSLTGRTKTTPTTDASDHLKFGVVSCSNFQAGYFNAYGRLAERNDLDAVIHLGDYIYEYPNFFYGSEVVWDDRLVNPPTEIIDLFDYRTRYATYRQDTNLLRLHQQHPMIAVWDDHESANDSHENGANNHTPATEGSWADRKAASRQAYFEWMPIRDKADTSVYRAISYGNLADLILLDTRLEGRDQQINDINDPALYAEERTILGEEQRSWFFDQLTSSTAKWKLVGQQVLFSAFHVGWAGGFLGQTYEETESSFLDIWDGYPAERQRVIDELIDNQIDNVVILTGDFHSSFAFDVAEPPVSVELVDIPGAGIFPSYSPTVYDSLTGAGSVAVEFATPSITSANFDENATVELSNAFEAQINQTILAGGGTVDLGNPNPHLKLVDLDRHGYFILDVREDSVQADYFYVPILFESHDQEFGGARYTNDGDNHLSKADGPTPPKAEQDEPAPPNPPGTSTFTRDIRTSARVLSISPNPASTESNLHFSLSKTSTIKVDITDQGGRSLRSLYQGELRPGLYTLKQSVAGLPAGNYFYRIILNGELPVIQPLMIVH